jgi:alkanesulfonate monooxygenase SsuD/methylene tetrahydromethanopterin reductase-like flavin-dependent oxidoreductase (luciferase family)
VRVGVTLPTFGEDAGGAIAAARAAEHLGIHGVFVFDHLWPLGSPGRPSLSLYPVLGAVAAATGAIRLGSLVARIGLLPDPVVLASMASLRQIAGGRIIAGLGTGDDDSAPEHERNGLPYLGARVRLESLGALCEQLLSVGIECWIGAGTAATNDVARSLGAVLNLWGATPERVAREVRRGTRVSWGGPLRGGVDTAAATLEALAAAGCEWAVWGWPSSLEAVVEAAAVAGVELGGG